MGLKLKETSLLQFILCFHLFYFFREGPIMGATLSTGDQTWEVKVMGNLAQNNKKNKTKAIKKQSKNKNCLKL